MNKLLSDSANYTDRKISLNRAISILAKNNIEVNDSEAAIILDFLYHLAQNYNKHSVRKIDNLKGKSNLLKM
jgi:hypothetical protein